MKKIIITIVLFVVVQHVFSQAVTTDPVFPKADEPVTITVDVTGTGLSNFNWNNSTNPVYLWAWLPEGCSSNCDAPTNVNPATSPAQDAAKAFRISTNKYQITLTPTTFFNKPASEISKLGILLKAKDWTGGKTPDYMIDISNQDEFLVSFSQPSSFPVFKNAGDLLPITANASASADLELKIDGSTVSTVPNTTSLNYTHTVAGPAGVYDVTISADNGEEVVTASFDFIVRSAVVNQQRPEGIIDGINYGSDPTKVVLSLWAPGKTSVYAVGDFSDWEVLPEYQMKKDGEHFWIELTGLTAGQEYGYQYFVEESVRIADPYADKILSTYDQYIPEAVYPDLKPYPEKAVNTNQYFNAVAVFQTAQPTYAWQVTDFEKPAKEKLVIYELLIRDFFGSDARSYQSLVDTIGYFKRLGVNAIELMPIMEFSNNDSWGYNPNFMFAPDKYYGPKDQLKAFIDRCHQEGIAVIFDIVMNQQDLPNPYLVMDFDFTALKPTANNKWFNVTATHPYNVFYDMNHESAYTKKYLDTVNYYWLKEYRIDGFRFDLSKGFTQTNHPDDVSAWSSYDQSRIDILKRMADKIWSHTPGAYVILEHLAANDEEKVLSEHGMMLWGNMNYAYNQNTKGFGSDSDLSWGYYKNREWTEPNLVSYMESHDEERLMFRNLQDGNVSGSYSVKTLSTALDRVKAASLLFYTIPGPKMLWQFGELGYDVSIEENGRTGAKPVKWEYYTDEARRALFDHTAELIRMRQEYDVFTSGDATLVSSASLQKQMTLKNDPYTATPANASEMNVQIAVNFEVTQKTMQVSFPHTGTWYDYYDEGKPVNVTATPFSIVMAAGKYKMYTDVPLKELPVTGVEDAEASFLKIFPNPSTGKFFVDAGVYKIADLSVMDTRGTKQKFAADGNMIDLSGLPNGLYLFKIITNHGKQVVRKVVKK